LHQGRSANANSSPERSFDYVALESGASAAEINVAKICELQKPTTVGVGGVTTVGDHSGDADETLWLSATAGRAGSAAVATLAQIVGFCSGEQKFIFDSTLPRWSNAELMAVNKTLDEQDCGKVMIATVDAIVVTLPATATGLNFTIVNGADDAAALLSVDPASGDLITGPDYAGTDNKDWQNTKATAKAGDFMKLQYKAATGWIVTELKGVWANEA
jgi:hypothetical protein